MMNLPNFLIVGAPKCGTTSLYHYLKGHPEIYMSSIKEPRIITFQFLNFPSVGPGDDIAKKRLVQNFDEYRDLFKNVNNEIAIGEASADNLYYYEQSIPLIKKYFGDVKIIIILRNPIDRAFSCYNFFIKLGREYLSFEDSLDNERFRKENNWLFGWYYTEVGFYYKQVKAFLSSFTNVKVLLFDDLKKDSIPVLEDVFNFLNVDTKYMPNNKDTVYNVSGTPRLKFWHKFLTKPNMVRSLVFSPLKNIISREKLRMYREILIAKNLTKSEMKPNTRLKLKKLFRQDILLLEKLLSRDLSLWLQ